MSLKVCVYYERGKKMAGLFALLKIQNCACSKVVLPPSAFFLSLQFVIRIQSDFGCIKLYLFFPDFSCAVSEYVILNTLHS